MKTCNKCKLEKNLDEFYKNKSQCKDCINLRNKIYRQQNLQTFKENRKKNYQQNIEKMRTEKRQYYREHIPEKKSYDTKYREQNKECIARYKRDWEKRNKDNPIQKIKRNLRRRIHHLLKNGYKSASTFELIGCTAEEFKLHIESQFVEGMYWENYGPKTWHIDHIIPCYKFDLTKSEEQRKCFHYTNQRPLWAKDNISRKRIE